VPDSMTGRPDIPYAASLVTPEWRVEEALRRRLAELGASEKVSAAVVQGGETETAPPSVLEERPAGVSDQCPKIPAIQAGARPPVVADPVHQVGNRAGRIDVGGESFVNFAHGALSACAVDHSPGASIAGSRS